jgi:16S rRNA (cytosine967-C5)-methyltransferase
MIVQTKVLKSITHRQASIIVEVLGKVMDNGFQADKELSFVFRNRNIFEDYDKAIIAEICYDVIRKWRLLLEIYNNYPVTREVDYWKLLGTWLVLNNYNIPEFAQLRTIDTNYITKQFESLSGIRKIRQSVPDWLDQIGFSSYNTQWDDELTALNSVPPVFIRVNRLKIKPAELSQKLAAEGFENKPIETVPDALMLITRSNIFSSKYFKDGFFEVQDAGSQIIAPFLNANPGMRVIDACAGNGGKTLHLACLMQNKGKILALDTNEKKLQTLKTRISRAGIDIIETRHIDNAKVVKRLTDTADRLLLDVPCSGTGAIKRNPEIKWRIDAEKINALTNLQAEILEKYSQMLKPGGILVYATCSILPCENQDQVKLFLEKQNGKFELIKEQFISPANTGFDGFYMAQIKKVH